MKRSLEDVAAEYQKSIYLAAFQICRNAEDANDIVQDTMLTYYLKQMDYRSEEHLRAWLLRVAINKAKDKTRSFWRRQVELQDIMQDIPVFEQDEEQTLFEEVMNLPEKYRIVIHLFYYEDYSVREIAEVLRISENNVKVRLSRGRSLLKEKLEG